MTRALSASRRLLEAAEGMRGEGPEYFARVADWLAEVAKELAESERLDPPAVLARRVTIGTVAHALAVADSYLADPGDLPDGAA